MSAREGPPAQVWWRNRRTALVGACLVLLAGVVVVVHRTVTAPPPHPLVLGTYKYGACVDCPTELGPNGVDLYASWLGAPVPYAEDNVGDTYWQYFEQGWPDSFRQWQEWKAAKPGRRMVFAVPFYVDEEQGSDHDRIAACAGGAYDSHYRALGTNLVQAGLGDSIVRIAWESHGTWQRWSYRNNPDDWRTCWRRVAQTMKAAAPQLRTNWNVGDDNGGLRPDMMASVNLRGFDNFYPGDDVVDEIGIDSYNAPRISDYDAMFGDRVGSLGWFARVAREHGKPLSFPEWGLWDNAALDKGDGSRDDPVYIEEMHAWMTDPANNVAWAAYFDINVEREAMHQLQPDWQDGTVFPEASARFKKLFGALRGVGARDDALR